MKKKFIPYIILTIICIIISILNPFGIPLFFFGLTAIPDFFDT